MMLKPANFTPILGLIGIIMIMASKSESRKDTGTILLGFVTLMFGMETMSSAVSGLKDIPQFQNILTMFSNPILGVLAGAILTAIIQSSSASVGILQALSTTGAVSIGSAIPIIMGQNIGTCVTAMLSSIGANKNAKRAAVVHLCFNIIGCVFWLVIFCVLNAIFKFSFVQRSADQLSIAIIHSVFNVLCTALLMPMSNWLERLATRLVPDKHPAMEQDVVLDERLLSTPAFAVDRCRSVTGDMAMCAMHSLNNAVSILHEYTPELAQEIREEETTTDKYEDMLGTYLVKLSSHAMSVKDSAETTKLLHVIGDLERISDHAVNILFSVDEMQESDTTFSETAMGELGVLTTAVQEVVYLAYTAFVTNDLKMASNVEPLEQVIKNLCTQIKTRHIQRLRNGDCSLEAGIILTDILTNLERVSDHCSNIGGCIMETDRGALGLHESLEEFRETSEEYQEQYHIMQKKYVLPAVPS